MVRRIFIVTLLLAGAAAAWAAEAKVIATAKTKDVVVTLSSDSGQWKPGPNAFLLEFASVAGKQPVDVGRATLGASMAMPGMAPMITGATLTPAGPGRYRGTITFPDAGSRQVTVTWDGPGGKASAKLSVAVR